MDALRAAGLRTIGSFDPIVERFRDARLSFTEEQALRQSHWEMGEDARLREDVRFRSTRGGRWILSDAFLANDALFERLARDGKAELEVEAALAELSGAVGRRCVFCPSDDRFVHSSGVLRLSARYLTRDPLIEEASPLERYATHLPVHTLEAVGASAPAGDWRQRPQEDVIETVGWLRVSLADGRRLTRDMFVARIQGHSMDNGRSGLVDGAYAVFELDQGGTRKDQNVLVRGSFRDPEMGNYAVKRYRADERDSEGRHARIVLESLNPDKVRYPDIVLDPREDEDVAVLARVVQPLRPADFGRVPRRPRRSGRRGLGDAAGQARRAVHLRRYAERFFEGRPETPSPGEEAGAHAPWQAHLVCLDAGAGGLHVETEPLEGLPPFAKKLALGSAGWSATVLASNLRVHRWRTAVPPSVEPYRWSAPGHEELLAGDLGALEAAGLAADRATLFRVDAEGVGRLLSGATLSLGGLYRAVLPPASGTAGLTVGETVDLEGGWRLWEGRLPGQLTAGLWTTLEALGAQAGRTVPEAEWVLVPPAAYRQTPRGASYPVFSPGATPYLSVRGVHADREGDVTAFLSAGEDLRTLRLPRGEAWVVALEGLPVGRYVFQVVHERTRFAPVALPFAVDEVPWGTVPARVQVRSGDRDLKADAAGVIEESGDFSDLGDEARQLALTVPPLWPVEAWWDDGRRRRLGRSRGAVEGDADLDDVVERAREKVARTTLADLELDARELGTVRFHHAREARSDDLRRRVRRLLDAHGETARALSGQIPLLRNVWLHPLLEVLGYGWEEPSAEELRSLPSGTFGLWLTEQVRQRRRVRRERARLLVLASPDADLDATDLFSVRRAADDLLDREGGVREALLTDGWRWARHRRRSHLALRVHRLDKVLDQDLFAFDDFLRDVAVGV